MPNAIKPKRSSVAGRIPTTSDLQEGEIAINTSDAKMYFKDTSGNIKEITSSQTNQLEESKIYFLG